MDTYTLCTEFYKAAKKYYNEKKKELYKCVNIPEVVTILESVNNMQSFESILDKIGVLDNYYRGDFDNMFDSFYWEAQDRIEYLDE